MITIVISQKRPPLTEAFLPESEPHAKDVGEPISKSEGQLESALGMAEYEAAQLKVEVARLSGLLDLSTHTRDELNADVARLKEDRDCLANTLGKLTAKLQGEEPDEITSVPDLVTEGLELVKKINRTGFEASVISLGKTGKVILLED